MIYQNNELFEEATQRLQNTKKTLRRIATTGLLVLGVGVAGIIGGYASIQYQLRNQQETLEQRLLEAQTGQFYIAEPCFHKKTDHLYEVTPCYESPRKN